MIDVKIKIEKKISHFLSKCQIEVKLVIEWKKTSGHLLVI